MRSSFISILLAAGTVSASVAGALVTASCSSSTSGSPGSSSGGSSSGSGSSGGGDDAGMDSGPPPCALYQNDADLTAPVISFSKDVMPIFEHSCGLSSSCHYDPSAIPTLGIFLGCDINSSSTCRVTNPGPQVYQDLVGLADGGSQSGADAGSALKPLEDPMPYVTPGDPTKSYLMHKLDGDTCTFTDCVADNKAIQTAQNPPSSGLSPNWCGQSMPYNSYMLPSSQASAQIPPGKSVPACGGATDCSTAATFSRDTIRAWIAQGALNN